MSLQSRVLDALTLVATLCAIVVAAIVLRREFRPAPVEAASVPISVPNWDRYIATGRFIGPRDAALTIVEFAEFQCPACKALDPLLRRLRTEYPRDFAISYHYAPLPYHQQAYPAARAAECAAVQGSFERYHDVLFDSFDSLRVVSFTELARRSNVPDLSEFAACSSSKKPSARVDTDRSIAFDSLHISGTPTVLVNGKMYPFAPTVAELRQMIEQARSSVPAHEGG